MLRFLKPYRRPPQSPWILNYLGISRTRAAVEDQCHRMSSVFICHYNHFVNIHASITLHTCMLLTKNRRFTIHSAFLDIKNSISWYQEMKWILDIKKYFLISRIFFDIKNSISWYQEIEFLISRIRFLDIKN